MEVLRESGRMDIYPKISRAKLHQSNQIADALGCQEQSLDGVEFHAIAFALPLVV